MLIADLSIDILPTRTRSPSVNVRRALGIAAALMLHVLLLLYVLLPPAPMRLFAPQESQAAAMSLVFIHPTAPVQRAMQQAPIASPPRSNSSAIPGRRRAPQPVPEVPSETAMTAQFIEPVVSAGDLFDDIQGAAAEVVAKDPRLPNAGMPRALGQVPGRAEPFIHLPLKHQQGGALKRTLEAIGKHMIVGGLPENPLHSMAQRASQDRNEPVCNDPENPLADERCWLPPEE
ncbi:MAG: hypothetical protein SGI99_09395 [Pseudomonadota bacterium]|nr:hypothetical protein [Pseudomonadota bacterium]